VGGEIEQCGDEHVAGDATHGVQMQVHVQRAAASAALILSPASVARRAPHEAGDDDRERGATKHHQTLRTDGVEQTMNQAVGDEVVVGKGRGTSEREHVSEREGSVHGGLLHDGQTVGRY